MSGQVPDSYRDDQDKNEFPRRVITGNSWTRKPLIPNTTAELTFRQLYSELEIFVITVKESVRDVGKHTGTS